MKPEFFIVYKYSECNTSLPKEATPEELSQNNFEFLRAEFSDGKRYAVANFTSTHVRDISNLNEVVNLVTQHNPELPLTKITFYLKAHS